MYLHTCYVDAHTCIGMCKYVANTDRNNVMVKCLKHARVYIIANLSACPCAGLLIETDARAHAQAHLNVTPPSHITCEGLGGQGRAPRETGRGRQAGCVQKQAHLEIVLFEPAKGRGEGGQASRQGRAREGGPPESKRSEVGARVDNDGIQAGGAICSTG